MAETEGSENQYSFEVSYDGEGDAHSMDVLELAPALVAFGKLIRETNAQLNGQNVAVKLLVTSDFEHRCFNISFEVIQNIIHNIAAFFEKEEVKSARQILADLGIIGGAGGFGLFKLLKWKSGRPATEVRDAPAPGVVIIQLGDGNQARVRRDVFELSKNPKVRAAVEGTLAPLGTGDITKIVFKGDRSAEPEIYDANDAKDIVASFDVPAGAIPDQEQEPDTVTAWLRVYSPVYDEKADKWRFWYGDHSIYADITETTIAKDALQRGGALVNDLYKVKMQIKQHFTKGGAIRLEYKIVSVMDFRSSPQQIKFNFDEKE